MDYAGHAGRHTELMHAYKELASEVESEILFPNIPAKEFSKTIQTKLKSITNTHKDVIIPESIQKKVEQKYKRHINTRDTTIQRSSRKSNLSHIATQDYL